MSSARSASPILALQKLRLRRGDVSILRDVSWEVTSGQHWIILGANGSGKSSLLAVLSGYLPPTAGSCSVLGQTFGESDWRDLRTHLGIVSAPLASLMHPEEPAARTVLTGRDGSIDLWGPVSKTERAEALQWLRKVEAEELADRPWGVLSQGERQRVLIARALIRSPKLLILDEPCAGLDPVARESLLAFLARLIRRKDGTAIVLVTHHVEEILPEFTHALLLHEGAVAAAGPIHTSLTEANLGRIFNAPLNLSRHSGRYRLTIVPPRRGIL
jgi:iron complex transport system ATP-binding protein